MALLKTTTAWQLAGTTSFRLGSRALFSFKPKFRGYGTNLQNRSPLESRIYKPSRPDYIFLQADQAGAEALIVAYLCRAAKFRDLFIYGIKPHVFVALHLFKEHWEKEHPYAAIAVHTEIPDIVKNPEWKSLEKTIKKHDRYYAIGKMVCHASNYGMEESAFQLNVLVRSEGRIFLSMEECVKFLSLYHRLFPEVREWQKEIREELLLTRTIRNLFGYPRRFEGHINEKTFKEAYAQKGQSTVGCITHIGYTEMQNYIEESRVSWNLLVNKHDSILLECPEEDTPIAGRILQASLEQDLVGRDGVTFRMRTELACGRNWGKYDKETNVEGMKEMIL